MADKVVLDEQFHQAAPAVTELDVVQETLAVI